MTEAAIDDGVVRQICELCGTFATRAPGWVAVDGELFESCIGCQAKVLLGERPGRLVR